MATDPAALTHDRDRSTTRIDENARFERIYRDHAAALRGRVLARTRDPALAEDVVGEAFSRLIGEIRAGRAPDDPGAWLHRVTANLTISRARRDGVATRALPRLLDRGLGASPEDVVIERDRDRLVRMALSRLGAADRQLVVMAAQGYSPSEIAGLTGRSHAATRTRLCRARQRLRTEFVSSGVA